MNIGELKDFEINEELFSFLKKIQSLEQILKNDELRYLFLVSLISSDNSVDEKSARNLLDKIDFIEKNLKYLNLSDKIKNEIKEHIIKGKGILQNDIKDFKKENKSIKYNRNNSKPNYNGYEEGFDGLMNKTFEI